ncbi:bifunctional molybdenum cofactor biosynthesis protein [Lasius niger]|uniref:Bifunctional molybdenum cofactor biosynthesis protein n=1 Tax=Lasius niger TaxID=67767 RepID=A0A0J7KIZ2_LASNI|nr:bifunctional molybdenum cofactor biosynthesis protein [Lasius niger]
MSNIFSNEKLFGLLLSGGKSQRMGKDKAGLCYEGRPQLVRAMEFLSEFTDQQFLSLRKDQQSDPLRQNYAPIFDLEEVQGPNSGLLAAHRAHPEVAWLVLACDLPFADSKALAPLVKARAEWQGEVSEKPVVFSWKSPFNGKAEPLCAIWEPAALKSLEKAVQEGAHCPRQAFKGLTEFLLTPEGKTGEGVEMPAEGLKALYEALKAKYHFPMPSSDIRAAVNDEFVAWDYQVQENDTIVFIPPVTGG